jgi:hypothetical protein
MRSLSAVKLKDVSAGTVDSQTDGAKSPKIIFYYSKAIVPTPQAKLNASVEKNLFSGESLGIGLLGRYFTMLKVNVTDVSPKDNRAFNRLTAPVVVVKASDGKRVVAFRGNVSEGVLIRAMITALKKDGINGAKIIAKGTAALNVIRKMVDEKARLKQDLVLIGKRLKDEKGAEAKILEQRQAQMKAEMEKVEKALKEAYDRLKRATEAT